MKVLYHHRTRASGAEGVHIQGIQGALRKLGYEIVDISLFHVRPESEEQQDVNAPRSIKQHILNAIASFLPNVLFKILEILYNCRTFIVGRRVLSDLMAKTDRPELIYERYAYFSFAIAFLSRKYRLPLVLEVNTTCLDYDVRKIRLRWLARKIEHYVFKRATLIVVVSSYLKNKIQHHYGIPDTHICITPNAVDPEQFSLSDRVEPDLRLMKARSFVQDKIVIGFVGIFVPWHGLDFLIDVFCDLVQTAKVDPSTVLVLVGDGPMRGSIEKKVHDAALSERVLITGKVPHEQIQYFLDLFDVAIMPDSNPFGSPMKIVEYMAMGKPIVAPAYGPVTEIITHGETGLLFNPRDKEACIKVIEQFLSSSELREQLGNNARQVVLTQHTWTKNVEKILQQLKLATGNSFC